MKQSPIRANFRLAISISTAAVNSKGLCWKRLCWKLGLHGHLSLKVASQQPAVSHSKRACMRLHQLLELIGLLPHQRLQQGAQREGDGKIMMKQEFSVPTTGFSGGGYQLVETNHPQFWHQTPWGHVRTQAQWAQVKPKVQLVKCFVHKSKCWGMPQDQYSKCFSSQDFASGYFVSFSSKHFFLLLFLKEVSGLPWCSYNLLVFSAFF